MTGGEYTAEQVDDARAAYAAYGATTGGRNYRGEPMPGWDALGDTIQRAWIAAAQTVRGRVELEADDREPPARPMRRLPDRSVAEARRDEVCEWLRANGVDPVNVPSGGRFEINGDRLTVEVVVQDAEGDSLAAWDRANGLTLRTKRTVPLVVPFPEATG